MDSLFSVPNKQTWSNSNCYEFEINYNSFSRKILFSVPTKQAWSNSNCYEFEINYNLFSRKMYLPFSLISVNVM